MKSIVVLLTLFFLYQGQIAKGTVCPKNWIRFGDTDRCYFVSEDYASFDVAKKNCDSMKSQFASVLTYEDEFQLSSILESQRDKCNVYGNCMDFWIGVCDYNGNNKWITTEGLPVDENYQFWAEEYPKYDGHCVRMSVEAGRGKGVWKNDNCERHLKYVCIKCPTGFKYVPEIDQCLHLNLEKKTWSNAREACAEKATGAQMLMIKDLVKQEAVGKFLQQELSKKESEICDAHLSFAGGKTFWMGGQTTDPNQCGTPFVWKPVLAPPIPFTYTNFYPGNPNCGLKGENCALLMTSPGKLFYWEDFVCDYPMCFVCEF